MGNTENAMSFESGLAESGLFTDNTDDYRLCYAHVEDAILRGIDKSNIDTNRVCVFLTTAIKLVSNRILSREGRYIELLKVAYKYINHLDMKELQKLVNDNNTYLPAVWIINNKCMTKSEFEQYEQVIYLYFSREIQDSMVANILNDKYQTVKNNIIKMFHESEKCTNNMHDLLFDMKDKNYRDYYYNTEQCFSETGIKSLGRNTVIRKRVIVFLTLAVKMESVKGVTYRDKIRRYIRIIDMCNYFIEDDCEETILKIIGNDSFREGVDFVSGKPMSEGEFNTIERIISYYLNKEIDDENRNKDTIRDIYQITISNVIQTFRKCEKRKMEKEKSEKKSTTQQKVLDSPFALANYLKKYVISQDQVIESLSQTIYQFLYYLKNEKKPPRSFNILLIGSSGSGKTTIMKTLNQLEGIEVKMLDSTGVTESGYRGRDPRETLVKPIDGSSIVFFDEFDKLLLPSLDAHGSDGHKEVVSNLYKTIEDKGGVNVFAGAFEPLKEIVKSRVKGEKHVGFSVDVQIEEEGNHSITEQDLLLYGCTREFLGRIDQILVMNDLTEEDYYRILKESESSPIKPEIQIAKDVYGIRLEFTDVFFHELAAKAVRQDIGARGLKQIIVQCVSPRVAEAAFAGKKRIRINSIVDSEPFQHGKEK